MIFNICAEKLKKILMKSLIHYEIKLVLEREKINGRNCEQTELMDILTSKKKNFKGHKKVYIGKDTLTVTPLIYAISSVRFDIFKTLMQIDAVKHLDDSEQQLYQHRHVPLLHFSVLGGSLEIFHSLLEIMPASSIYKRCGSISLGWDGYEIEYETALHWAIRMSKLDFIQACLKRDLKRNATVLEKYSISENKPSFYQVFENQNLLHLVAKAKNYEVADFLLKDKEFKENMLERLDCDQKTPLERAILEKNAEIIACFLLNGVNLGSKAQTQNHITRVLDRSSFTSLNGAEDDENSTQEILNVFLSLQQSTFSEQLIEKCLQMLECVHKALGCSKPEHESINSEDHDLDFIAQLDKAKLLKNDKQLLLKFSQEKEISQTNFPCSKEGYHHKSQGRFF